MSAETADGVERYEIDPTLSRFTVRAFASGMLSVMGHNPTVAIRDFSGEAEFIPGTLEKAALHLKIVASSLEVTNNMSDKDRREIERNMFEEVLEAGKYPEITFSSSSISASRAGEGQYMVNLAGKLSMHSVTNNQPVTAQVTVNGEILRAHGEFSVKQTAYGIKLVSVAGGTLKLKDELKCSFDIVAHKLEHNK